MTKATELRAESDKLREFARGDLESDVVTEIQLMIAELERRARALGDGDAT
jgi:hypothetical protein